MLSSSINSVRHPSVLSVDTGSHRGVLNTGIGITHPNLVGHLSPIPVEVHGGEVPGKGVIDRSHQGPNTLTPPGTVVVGIISVSISVIIRSNLGKATYPITMAPLKGISKAQGSAPILQAICVTTLVAMDM